MNVTIKYRHVEPTDAIKAYVEEKMQTLEKYADLVRLADVEVGKISPHHKNGDVFFCKTVFELTNGEVLRIDRDAQDLYKAIDKVRDHARQELGELHRREVSETTREQPRLK